MAAIRSRSGDGSRRIGQQSRKPLRAVLSASISGRRLARARARRAARAQSCSLQPTQGLALVELL